MRKEHEGKVSKISADGENKKQKQGKVSKPSAFSGNMNHQRFSNIVFPSIRILTVFLFSVFTPSHFDRREVLSDTVAVRVNLGDTMETIGNQAGNGISTRSCSMWFFLRSLRRKLANNWVRTFLLESALGSRFPTLRVNLRVC